MTSKNEEKESIQEVKNFKGMRRKPKIYGLDTTGAIITFSVLIMCLLTLIGGFNLTKILIVSVVIGSVYFLCMTLASDTIRSFLYDEKLPKKYSNYE